MTSDIARALRSLLIFHQKSGATHLLFLEPCFNMPVKSLLAESVSEAAGTPGIRARDL